MAIPESVKQKKQKKTLDTKGHMECEQLNVLKKKQACVQVSHLLK